MAQGTKSQPAPVNGTAAPGPGPNAVGVNRKKAKRRAKQAAKQAAQQSDLPPSPHDLPDSLGAESEDAEPYDDGEGPYDSEEDIAANGYHPAAANAMSSRRRPVTSQTATSAPPFSQAALKSVTRSATSKDKIWNSSTQEERENIKAFWLSLGEEERKSLVKIEKEAVLKKMKEQQKHSCSCTVCGRKRTAIEEELEVLYDAYYEELEQYANHPSGSNGVVPMMSSSRSFRRHQQYGGRHHHHHPPDRLHAPPSRRLQELGSEDDEDEDEEEDDEGDSEEEYSEEEYDDEDISDDEGAAVADIPRVGPAADFFNFGNSLTVKGGILTVADDLLKNDGKKFIEMMEQLAERRMQREEQAQSRSDPHLNPAHSHGDPLEEEEYDDEEYDDEGSDEEGYEDDDMVGSAASDTWTRLTTQDQDSMSEEQRMEEGRRMFQIFAARMFEQRVLTAYREKVAAERQDRLLQELDEESLKEKEQKAKKARDAQKKKDKKALAKQAKAEEKARKEAEKAREEAEARALQLKEQEEKLKRREEARKKKEAEKKAQEEEKLRKEAEKQKRLQEQREKQQESERKAQEKKARDEARRREREEQERDAKDKEAKEKKALEDKARREREVKSKSEKDAALRKVEQSHTAASGSQNGPTTARRAPHPVPVALPPGLLPRQPSMVASPQVPVATPAVSKAPTPNRQRQPSQQGSHGSSPKTPQVGSGTDASISPGTNDLSTQSTGMPKQILTKPPQQPVPLTANNNLHASSMHPIGPPGIHPYANPNFAVGVPPGLNGFPAQSPLLPGMGQRPPGPNMPMYPMHHQNQMPNQFRGFGPGNIPPPPPGMGGPQMMPPHNQGFGMNAPPGFPSPIPGMGGPLGAPGFREGLPPHSRQASASFEKPTFDTSPVGFSSMTPAPIQRPNPIQRPSSVKPAEDGFDNAQSDVDDLRNHLGSKALLDDTDEPIPSFSQNDMDLRRSSMPQGASRVPFGNGQMYPGPPSRPRVESFGLGGPGGNNNTWSNTTGPFGPLSSSLGATGGWGGSPTGNRFGYGAIGQSSRPSFSRPVSIRLKAIQAWRDISAMRASHQGHELEDILHLVNLNSPDSPTNIDELRAILETEGDSTNGGGLFHFDQSQSSRLLVRFEEGAEMPANAASRLGEIGSPVPEHSVPLGAFGHGHSFVNPIGSRPFPNLGPA